jgi:hypothetical protein
MERGEQSVEATVASYIETLLRILTRFTGSKLSGRYYLDDQQWTSIVLDSHDSSLLQDFTRAHYVRYEYLKEFYELLFAFNSTTRYGNNGITALDLVLDTIMASQRVIEAGGGMGSGFQLYCDDEMIVSTGGGGGGGASREGGMLSFGSGGGGGIQISKAFSRYLAGGTRNREYDPESNEYYSMGGGGGCGSCTDTSAGALPQRDSQAGEATSSATAVCGSSVDADAVTLDAVRSVLQHPYVPTYFSRHCQQVRVLGGGGGGGGIAYADAASIGAGYGFSFEFISKPVATSSHDPIASLQRVSSDVRLDRSEDAPSYNLQERNASGLLDAVAGACGGYSNWPCMCAAALQRVQACANSTTTANEDTTEDMADIDRAATDLDCRAVNAMRPSLEAMLHGSCTHGGFHSGNISTTSNINTISNTSDLCPMDAITMGTSEYRDSSNNTLQVTYTQRVGGRGGGAEDGAEGEVSYAALLGGLYALPNALNNAPPLLSASVHSPMDSGGLLASHTSIVFVLFALSLLCVLSYCTRAYSNMDRSKYTPLP